MYQTSTKALRSVKARERRVNENSANDIKAGDITALVALGLMKNFITLALWPGIAGF